MTVDTALTGRALLAAAAAEVASWPAVSDSRARQVRWVAGEYGRALEHADHPLGDGATRGELFRRVPVDAYLVLARRGELRVRAARDPKKPSPHSEQTRVEVLGLLATACEALAELPPQPDPPSKAPVAPRPRALLRDSLHELADRADALPGQVRMLAIGAVVSDTAARSGELCAVTLEDLAPTLEEVRLLRRPQGRAEDQAYRELAALSGLARAALRRWLTERQALMARVGGTATALWVSLHANHHDGQAVPPGTPLMPRGLSRAWTRAVAETNDQMAGEPSWAPLPTRMEQLRRGVRPTATEAPREVDAEKAVDLLAAVTATAVALAAARADGGEGSTAELRARVAARQAVRDAWAEGIEHHVLLGVLGDAGLRETADLAAAGWEPVLLAALDRAVGWGRPRRAERTGNGRHVPDHR
ncbi:hypothetical protein [Kitasatospora sp. NPDC059160]|uniref:hypothetical protein n=1 Tax=Kitasatospora sp. NPDC059160 TaxID=3346748 RepID=UPI0036827C3F